MSVAQLVNNPQDDDSGSQMLPLGPADGPYSSVSITEIERGTDDTLATFTLRIGGIKIRRVQLRQGRGSVHINYPAFKTEAGRWKPFVEIVSPSLDAFVTKMIHQAVSEVVR